MRKVNVNIKKLVPEAVLPDYAHISDAGVDLVATSIDTSNKSYIQYGTGLAVEIPEGYVGLIFSRSSVSKYDLQLSNCVGVIDSGYRGEIILRFRRVISPYKCSIISKIFGEPEFTSKFSIYDIGDKVGQLIIMPYPKIHFNEVEELSQSDRGDGGFGSSDRCENANQCSVI